MSALATRYDMLANQIARRGRLASRAVAMKLRTSAFAALRARDPKRINTAKLTSTLVPLVRDTMLASYLTGYKAARASARRPGIKLSVFDKVIAALAKQLDIGIDELRDKFDTKAYEVITGLSEKVESELQEALYDLIKSGAHVQEAIEVLDDAFDKLGLSPLSDFKLETIFRTQSQLAFGAGRWESDQDPAIQEILWGYEYVTVGDDRVRPSHEALEGVRLPKDDPFWQTFWPPNGWNCRCQAIPIFKDEEPDPVEAPSDAEPDEGFAFNAGKVFVL